MERAIKYLGFVVESSGVQVDLGKVKVIKEWDNQMMYEG